MEFIFILKSGADKIKLMKINKLYIGIVVILLPLIVILFDYYKTPRLPVIAIASYGPHSSLTESIIGIESELARQGFIDNQNIKYQVVDVGFNSVLIPQMIMKFKSQKPMAMVVITTPVAEVAKGFIKDIPLVYDAITDPVSSHLIKEEDKADGNMTGSSDRQDLSLVLKFAKQLLPNAKRVGFFYSTAESNDLALLKMMEKATSQNLMQLVAIPVDNTRDLPIKMQLLQNKVDLIYVGTSGPIQPALPVIAAAATKMSIPVFNADKEAVKENMVLASYGVDYMQVGVNAGRIVADILRGKSVNQIAPIYPSANNYYGFISRKKAEDLGIEIKPGLTNVTIVE